MHISSATRIALVFGLWASASGVALGANSESTSAEASNGDAAIVQTPPSAALSSVESSVANGTGGTISPDGPPTGGPGQSDSEQVIDGRCDPPMTLRVFLAYARPVFRRTAIEPPARRRLRVMRRCADFETGRRIDRRLHALRRERQRRLHPWKARYRVLPAWLKQKLRQIRSCETRGIPYPQNYRYRGYHWGAYQVLPSTWRAMGGRRPAYSVDPREQDVRVARWYIKAGPGQWPNCA